MRKSFILTAILSLSAAAGAIALGKPGWAVPIVIGAGWGLANFWCMTRAIACVVEGRKGVVLSGWIAAKFILLYGLAGWLLIEVRISPVGWLLGFTLSLIAMGLSAFPSLRSITMKTASSVCALLLVGASKLAFAASKATTTGEGHGAHGGTTPTQHAPEIPNLITVITSFGGEAGWVHWLHTWENTIYAFVIVGIVGFLFSLGARKLTMTPGRGQVFAEMVIEGLDNLVCGVLGKKEGRRYLPFLGTLFLFILAMNLAGLVPGLKSPTSRFEMTMALGLIVFVFVQGTGIKRLGIVKYIDHMIGEPRDAIGWILAPLMLFIHGIGEIVKPVSLALRLFGNIMGEDTLLGVFVALGALCFAWSNLPIGIPFHLPFVLLAIIFSTVQALVFTMLSMIYIYMMLPHEEHHEEHHAAQHGPAGVPQAVGSHHGPA